MKKRIKLIASLTSLTLVLAVMTVGVMAATKLTVNFSNSVTYLASAHVKAIISGTKLAGENTIISGGGEAITPINISGSGVETGKVLAIGDV
ncbi:MAG: hypothetical protein PHX09_02610, partial [Clostridia bacterium]|nr:hypothetical protein [Clostridia bacterium]